MISGDLVGWIINDVRRYEEEGKQYMYPSRGSCVSLGQSILNTQWGLTFGSKNTDPVSGPHLTMRLITKTTNTGRTYKECCMWEWDVFDSFLPSFRLWPILVFHNKNTIICGLWTTGGAPSGNSILLQWPLKWVTLRFLHNHSIVTVSTSRADLGHLSRLSARPRVALLMCAYTWLPLSPDWSVVLWTIVWTTVPGFVECGDQ